MSSFYDHVFIIAEAGVNHNGSIDMARKLVDAAAESGADAVKFQSFRADHIISRYAPKAEYQTRTTNVDESQLEMVRKLELSEGDHEILIAHALAKGISFLSTPFDLPSLYMLTQHFDMKTIKVPSGEITNAPFLLEISRTGRRVILSTGMSTLDEVGAALGVLAFGYTAAEDAELGEAAFETAFSSDSGKQALQDCVSLLHCTTEYPAPYVDINLKAMDTLKHVFNLPIGLSDHSPGIHIPIAAVARGAGIIEKHFTLDRDLPGPDHAASLEPSELKDMIQAIRDVESAMGDGVKQPAPSELKNRDVARRSLVAARGIRAGQVIVPADITAKRPGTGLSPFEYWNCLGEMVKHDFKVDELLKL